MNIEIADEIKEYLIDNGNAEEYFHQHEIEAATLDELKELVEAYVSEILDKINSAIKAVF